MKRRIIACLMALTVLFGNIFFTYKDARANPLVWGGLVIGDLAISAASMAGVSGMFATQGVTFSDAKSSRNAVAEFVYKYPDAVKQSIASWPSTQLFKAKSAIKISQSVWNASMEYLNTLDQGAHRKSMDVSVSADGNVTAIVAGSETAKMISCGGLGFAYLTWDSQAGVVYEHMSWTDATGKIFDQIVKFENKEKGPYTLKYIHTLYDTLVRGGIVYTEYRACYETYDKDGVKAPIWPQTSIVVQGGYSDAYIGSNVGVEDAYYDYTKSGVAIPVPQTAEGDRVIAVPLSIPQTGAVGLTGDMCIPSVNTLTQADTYTDATTGETATTEFRYPEMQVPADTLKNKFPFSVPWDLKLAVTSLVADPVAPKWEIDFDKNYFIGGGKFVIDFKQFEVWAKIIRWGILIIFNIFLIIRTKELVGAS